MIEIIGSNYGRKAELKGISLFKYRGKGFLGALLLAIISGPAQSQDVSFELVDTGVLDHATHGRGIEMRIQPSDMPSNEALEAAVIDICRHYAPSVIPFVIENAEIPEPNFIAVRFVSGGLFGRYFLQAFTIEDGTCGDPL